MKHRPAGQILVVQRDGAAQLADGLPQCLHTAIGEHTNLKMLA